MAKLGRNEFTLATATLMLVLYTLILSVVAQVVLPLMRDRTISNVGSVKAIGVGVYWDQNCTSAVSAIDWGILEPGSTKNVTVYIKNEGNTAISLSMTTSNWNPSNATSYLSLNWDYDGQTLAPESIAEVTLVLTVSANITGITNFSFDIVITGIS
jgi:hypothetical protein